MMLTGLIGWPVAHSRSPVMHNQAFAAAGIAGRYVPLPTPHARVGEAVRGLRALGFRGANVTVPHKQAVMPYLDSLSPAAQAIGAVNTIVVQEDGRLFGDNTDAPGFWTDLLEQGIDPERLRDGGALILGAGGSARAITYALALHNIPTTLLARRPQQAQSLIDDLAPHLPAGSTPILPKDTERFHLVVHCTPVGMSPHTHASPLPPHITLRAGMVVYDLVYNPTETLLMQQAQAVGATAINGLGMLLHQGALAWQLWTNQAAPLAAMRAALLATL